MAVGSASAVMITGSRRRRAASRSEYALVWICAATKTAENVIPANVIIPAASAPKICSTAPDAIGSRSTAAEPPVQQRERERERDRRHVRGEHRHPHRGGQPEAGAKQAPRGRHGVGRRGSARLRFDHWDDPAGTAAVPSSDAGARLRLGVVGEPQPRIG